MYCYRNFPCTIQPDSSLLWCVSGHDEVPWHNSSGVLEWCRDEMDAHRILRMMRDAQYYQTVRLDPNPDYPDQVWADIPFAQFSNLRAHKYTEGKSRIAD